MKSITTKVLLSIGGVTICSLALIMYFSYSLTNKQINEVIEQQASMALQFDLAIRGYIGGTIRPIMYQLIDEDEFIVEAMSTTYVARSVFDEVRKKFPEYIIKFSSDNPRNPINQAGPEELKIIEQFNNNPKLNKWEGIITIKGKKYMAKFNARRMKKSCLYCHGDPQKAPASLIEKYGSIAGFNREIGKVIGMDTVAIPMNKITEKIWSELKTTVPVFILGLLVFFGAVIMVIKLLVINRLVVISEHFRSAAKETDYSQIARINVKGKDEISDLASGYNTLTDRLKNFYSSLSHKVKERTQSLEKANEKLLQEINKKNEAEKALRESQTRFKALHNASFGGIAIHDKGVILDCNQGLSEMTGYSQTELVGMDGLLLIAEKSRDLVMRNIVGGYEKAYEATGLRKNGEEYPIRLEARNIPYKGKQVRTVEFRDITENKKAEEEREKLQAQLIQAQKMESIGNLAGGIAHDFNNLLFPIIGMSEMLLEDLPKDSPEHENAQEIFHAGRRAGELVNQILAFSRQSEHKMIPVHVQNVLKEVLKLSRSTIPTNIEIEQNIQQDCGLVMADTTQIHQIAMNLITNAYHAVEDENGIINIELKEVIIDENGLLDKELVPGKYVKLSVSDNGMGMAQSTISKIFDPYFTTKEKGKGTGLGLSVVYGIVKLHKGEITVSSEVGRGTTFGIYLPLMEKNSEAVFSENVSELETGTESILLIDDEISVAKLEGQLLSRLGYEVTVKTDSEDALNTFKSNSDSFDLVISDMTMPTMTGDQLAKKILAVRPEIPIIICTGFSERINKEQAEILGIKGFLMKPVVKSDMASMVRKVMDAVIEKRE